MADALDIGFTCPTREHRHKRQHNHRNHSTTDYLPLCPLAPAPKLMYCRGLWHMNRQMIRKPLSERVRSLPVPVPLHHSFAHLRPPSSASRKPAHSEAETDQAKTQLPPAV